MRLAGPPVSWPARPATPSSARCAGAKSRADMYQAFELIYPVLQGFKKGAPTATQLPAPAVPTHQVTPLSLGAVLHGRLTGAVRC